MTPLSASSLEAFAMEMKRAQDEGRQIDPFTSRVASFNVCHAYAVARSIHEARCAEGAVAIGRKIGFTNPDMWIEYGVDAPIWAYLYDRTVVHVESQHVICDTTKFSEPKIEPEIVFHFRSAPPVGGDSNEILAAIDWVAHGFEIVQSHFPGWQFQAADTIADAGLHGMLFIGEHRPLASLGPEPALALESFSLSLLCNGERRAVGRGSMVLGSPLRAIAHLNAVLENQSDLAPLNMPPLNTPRLRADEIVTTGTITTAQTVRAGEIWTSQLRGIGLDGLTVEFR